MPVGLECRGCALQFLVQLRLSQSFEGADGFAGDPEKAREDFERLFITSPEKAAQQILTAVQRDRRRALIGPDAKVIDFVTFSSTGVCMFGRANNPKFTAVKSLEDFNKPDITLAYFTGAGEEPLMKQTFANAKLRGGDDDGAIGHCTGSHISKGSMLTRTEWR